MTLPLVSAVLLTRPERARFLPLAIECIRRQTYPLVELVIDGGAGPIGVARNRACSRADGDIVAFFDDDDWSAPDRIAKQVLALMRGGTVCGTSVYHMHDLVNGYALEQHEARGVLCGSLAFWRHSWAAHPFDEQNQGECNWFCEHYADATADLRDDSLTVYMRHPRNTVAPGVPIYGADRERSTARVREIMGDDLARYVEAARETAANRV